MVSQRRKTILNQLYGIKDVSGQLYGEGFYDALDWFDKKIRRYLIEKGLLQEFANYIASKRLNKLFRLRSKWQSNLYNNLVSKTFKVLKRNNVSTVFIGDITNIRENVDWGKKGNKMLHNYWAYDTIYHKCGNKAEENGIISERDTEEYSSRRIPPPLQRWECQIGNSTS